MLNQDKIAIWLKFVNLECDKLSAEILEPHGLTLTQYKVLKFLLINPQGTIRQVDIEEHFYIRNLYSQSDSDESVAEFGKERTGRTPNKSARQQEQSNLLNRKSESNGKFALPVGR